MRSLSEGSRVRGGGSRTGPGARDGGMARRRGARDGEPNGPGARRRRGEGAAGAGLRAERAANRRRGRGDGWDSLSRLAAFRHTCVRHWGTVPVAPHRRPSRKLTTLTPFETTSFSSFASADTVETTATGLVARLRGGLRTESLRVDVMRDDIVRLKISRGGRFDESPTFAVRDDLDIPSTPFTVDVDDERARVTTSELVVSVSLDPFRIDVHRPDGSIVLEASGAGDAGSATYATLNDAFTFTRRITPGDVVYGLGEKTGPQNRRGRDYTLWNVDVLNPTATGEFVSGLSDNDPRADRTSTSFDPYYMSIPFLYHQDAQSGRASGSFVDNGYRGHYDFTAPDSYAVRFDGGQYTEYVFAGPDIPNILEGYTWLTGRLSLPPLWALGYHQCRWENYTQADVEALAQKLRELEIPCDSMWLDIEYMDGYRVFSWNRDLFPEPEQMLARLAEDGFRTITIIDPGVKAEPGYAVFDEAIARDVLCKTEGGDLYIGQVWPGDTAFPDFATEGGREWWGELNARHVASGLAGIWNDMNEPATGRIEPYPMRFGNGEYSHDRYHNQYALLMAMGTVQGLNKAMPGLRTFVLSRAGSAGIQRFAANWMGDNLSRWDHLRVSIAMANGLGLSGQPFVGADIGGFAGDCSPELFARWIQYGALTPFCRNHSVIGSRHQYPWAFGDAVLDIARDAIDLRYRLLPYIYSAFVAASETGAPVQRALAFDDQYDATIADIDDQYLFGPHLLVAPVVDEGATARQVYLPRGHWYDWHTDEPRAGGRYVTADAPMERIPLYARAGAVIPMLANAPQSTHELAPTVIELHVFAPVDDGSWHSFLQEDDGLTLAALDGARVRTRFALTRAGDTVTLEASVSGAGFDGGCREQFVVVLHGATASAAVVDGNSVELEAGRVTVEAGAFRLTVEVSA
jgi:alpha-glucosidase